MDEYDEEDRTSDELVPELRLDKEDALFRNQLQKIISGTKKRTGQDRAGAGQNLFFGNMDANFHLHLAVFASSLCFPHSLCRKVLHSC